jgi:hypothetical protein
MELAHLRRRRAAAAGDEATSADGGSTAVDDGPPLAEMSQLLLTRGNFCRREPSPLEMGQLEVS